MRPKFTLTDYKGMMMFERAIQYYIGKYNVTIGILKEHDTKYNISTYIKNTYDKLVNVVVLDELTTGPAHTVYEILKKCQHIRRQRIFYKRL